jgi:hypothetical protein
VDGPVVAGRLVHPANLLRVEPERLLAHRVLAVLRGRQGDRPVGEVRRGDDDGVDLRIGAERLGVGGDLLDPPIGLPLFQQRRIGVADGNQPGARIESDARDVVVIADRARADDGDPDGGLLGFWRHAGAVDRWSDRMGRQEGDVDPPRRYEPQ